MYSNPQWNEVESTLPRSHSAVSRAAGIRKRKTPLKHLEQAAEMTTISKAIPQQRSIYDGEMMLIKVEQRSKMRIAEGWRTRGGAEPRGRLVALGINSPKSSRRCTRDAGSELHNVHDPESRRA
jgi:hypothetical protein